ncbi:MAG: hypothetical protein V1766_00305 [Pseudomonadota bacterium]
MKFLSIQYVTERCARYRWLDVCGGNFRARLEEAASLHPTRPATSRMKRLNRFIRFSHDCERGLSFLKIIIDISI